MTALVALLLQLLFGVAGVVSPPAPVVFHDVPQLTGLPVVHCSQQEACVPLTGNVTEPHTLPGSEVLP